NPVHALMADGQGVGTIIFAPPPVNEYIIDNGAQGYQKNAGWTTVTNTMAYQLDYDYHAAGTGSGAATSTFAGSPPGSYQVFAKWIPFSNRATNAPYSIFDAANKLATVTVNQQQSPSGDTSNGIVWQSLGTFQNTTGVLAVKLNDNANGYVVADAIRL